MGKNRELRAAFSDKDVERIQKAAEEHMLSINNFIKLAVSEKLARS